MTNQLPIRVLLADDHPVVREGLAALLNRRLDTTVIGEVANGQEAVDFFRRTQPDVTLMDLRMPIMGGVEAIHAIRAEFPAARIIVLTTYDGDEDIYRALQAGAQGYLLKDAPREELLAAVHAVHDGQKCIPSALAAKLAERVFSPELTAREREVLALIVAGHSNREIGAALVISEGTVKAHVNSVLGKLGVNDRTQAVTAALRRGLVRLD